MNLKRILIVEDDREISGQLVEFLGNNGYCCTALADFADVPGQIMREEADMVLLDLSLPGTDGLNVLRQLRKQSDVPVIIVTSKDTEMDEVMCMSYGADNFIAKPYNPSLLLLHIEAVFKRLSPAAEENTVTYGAIKLDIGRGLLLIDGDCVELTRNEIKILGFLIRHQGKIVTREELIGYLWDSEEFVDDNTLTVNVNRVRAKLRQYGQEGLIQTKRGMGYRLG